MGQTNVEPCYMLISEKQIMQLMTQIKEHIELLTRIGNFGDYRDYLIDFQAEIVNQQSEELKNYNND